MGSFEVVDPRYRTLFDRTVSVLSADHRVIDVAVSGSIADGTADAWSDLDVEVVTDPEAHEAFLREWPVWLARITPTVFAQTPIAPFIINTVTPEGLTFDLVIYGGHPAAPFRQVGYRVGALASQPFVTLADALEYAVAEQLRGLAGPFITLIQRDEHLRHFAGAPHDLSLISTVFLAETGSDPPGKIWNETFTEEQQAAIAGLPALRATRVDIMAFALGLAELLVRRARPLYPRYDLEWPSGLAAVASRRLSEELGVDTSSWLY